MNFVTLITLEYNRSIRVQVGKDTMSHSDFIFLTMENSATFKQRGDYLRKTITIAMEETKNIM